MRWWLFSFWTWIRWCEDDVEIGSSDGYKIASDMLMNSINFSIDPCDDFFEFTCGNWIAKNPIKKHMSRSSQFDLLNDQVNEQVRGIFVSNETFRSKSITALKAIYKKCMDTDKLNRRGAKRLIAKVKRRFAWPIVDGDKKWEVKDYDLTSLLVHVSRIRGVNVFVSWDIYHDDKNVSRRIIQFDQADLRLGRSREYYLDMTKYDKKIEALRRYLIRQAKLFQRDGGRPTYRKKIENDVNEMIDLEIKLAKILVPEENRRNWTRMYNLYHLSDMQKLMPLVNWTRYFLAVAPSSSHNYLKSNPEIIIREVDYMRNLSKLLRRVKPRIITNYVFMRLSKDWEGEMGEDYEKIAEEFNLIMYGKKEKPPREIYCIRHTVNLLQYATSAVYVRKMFNQESKAVVLKMINDIQRAFREMLSTNKWINSTRNAALEKANSMLSQIAYPNFVLNDEELDNYYDGLDVRESDSYSKMLDKVARWHIEHSFKLLMERVDRHEYDFNSATVNAYYMPTTNSIKFPAAILQAPFFHHTFPRALNYGAIGSIIAHEISHAFDDEGSQYDAIGNLREWWDADVKKKYHKRAQCLIDQYGKIEVPGTGHKINGELTVGENIADNGGVKSAYRAYKAYLRKHGEELKIKGLEGYSSEQIFFMGYATAFCGDYTKDGLIDYLLRTPHSPMRYRVNQVLANQRGFAAAFSCEKGSKMNPEKRCGVW
ncbi:unnamed protein product [Cylicocyclus nassatus]|uniref:Uncharacterized protein n=1 Tax=Cylicocyclus nassatus TaxID=53992 RepID=A0AA36M5L7_CYLNA|nr:unnamed protein product [Cylicocyclus nassatus]